MFLPLKKPTEEDANSDSPLRFNLFYKILRPTPNYKSPGTLMPALALPEHLHRKVHQTPLEWYRGEL